MATHGLHWVRTQHSSFLLGTRSEFLREQLIETHESVHHSPTRLRVIVHVVTDEGSVLVETSEEESIVFVGEFVKSDHGVPGVEEGGGEGGAAQGLVRLVTQGLLRH